MELFAGANDKKQIAEMTRFLNAYSMLQPPPDIGARALDIIKGYSKADGIDPMMPFLPQQQLQAR